MLAIRRKRFRNVTCILRRGCEPLHSAYTVGSVPEDALIPLTVGLKCNALSVGGPNRITVSPFQRQPLDRARAGKIIDPDVGFLPIIGTHSETRTVVRDARMHVGSWR